ncbi:MAG TPA: SpaA isopeptide-forming pilin-related protein, partial [Mycobacteriales bacterium]|nr:SpaA isopeptide-forming pilin-related protein [Mycobacteriales bacterium]
MPPTVAPTTPPEPTTGTLTVTVADANGPVGGACVDVTNPSGTYTFCDGDNSDGTIEISDVVFGTQQIAMSTVPDGYRTPAPQTVELNADQQSAEVAFTLEAAAGSIAVTVTDANGAPIADACVAVDGGEPQCTGANGTVTFENLPVGQHTVSETSLPDGYQALDPVQVTVEDGEAVPASFQHPVPTGAIQVTSADPDGANVGGACVAIDGGEPLCDVDGDGVLNFPDVPAGGHEVAQTAPPDGYQPADPATQKVDVVPGQTAPVTFTNAPATGGIAVTVTGPDGTAVPGVCVAVSAEGQEGQTLCEPGDDGAFHFAGLAPGQWTVSVSQVPDGFVQPDGQTADVAAGQEATVAFELSEAPPETGSALLTLVSEDGQAASGVCIMLVPQAGGDPLGPYCDNGDTDGDATEGVLLIEDIPAGSYEVSFPDVGSAAGAIDGLMRQGGEPIVIEIIAGQTIEQTITVPGLVVLGSIEIDTVDAATGDPVAGACYTVDTAEPTTVCDGGDGDGSTEDGTVLIGGLPASDYTVTMSTPPENYGGADPQPATVSSGQTVSLEFRITAQVTTGSLTIQKLDDGGDALPGACFRLDGEGGSIGPVCDNADGANDGTSTFGDVPAGTYTLIETRTPSSAYAPAPPRQVTIAAGENLEIEVTNSAAPGRLNVNTVDAADQSVKLDNACYRLDGGTTYGPFCDGDDLSVDGRTVFTGVRPGTYTLVETQAPAGYDAAPNREVTIRAGVTHQITVQNQKTPPPPEAGT